MARHSEYQFIKYMCMQTVQATTLWRTKHLLHNSNGLVAISKSMQAVNLCSNKILQFLTINAGQSWKISWYFQIYQKYRKIHIFDPTSIMSY